MSRNEVRPARPSIWDALRWLLVLPGAIGAYLLTATGFWHLGDAVLLWLFSVQNGFACLFALASFAGVCVGALLAPRRRFWTASGLTLSFTVGLVLVVSDSLSAKASDASILPFAGGQIVTALLAAWLFWWLERRTARRFLR